MHEITLKTIDIKVGVILVSGDFCAQDWEVRYATICARKAPLCFYLVAGALQRTSKAGRAATTFCNSALIGLLVVANVC